MTAKPAPAGLIHRKMPLEAAPSIEIAKKQYQSTMDVPCEMPHPPVMEFSKGGGADEAKLLSVVVDDDESVRESLPDLLREFGFAARAFSSAQEFLSSGCIDEASYLILDIAMPGMTGPELYEELKRRGKKIPVIFITGQRDEAIRTKVFSLGASALLHKPFNDADLLAAIKTAVPSI